MDIQIKQLVINIQDYQFAYNFRSGQSDEEKIADENARINIKLQKRIKVTRINRVFYRESFCPFNEGARCYWCLPNWKWESKTQFPLSTRRNMKTFIFSSNKFSKCCSNVIK